MELIEDKIFDRVDFVKSPLGICEYDSCTFKQCVFAPNTVAGSVYIDCVFEDCDLSNIKLAQTSFRQVQFKGCKMIGLRFDECNPSLLSFNFIHCNISHSVLVGLKLKGIQITHAHAEGVDFTDTDLTGAILNHTNFLDARFVQTNLEKADFRQAIHYGIDPTQNKLKKAKFSPDGLPGLLSTFGILVQ
jgi:uncharacterized protein YjbI with pentapeptide repeats